MLILNTVSDIAKYLTGSDILPILHDLQSKVLNNADILNSLKKHKKHFEENKNTKCLLVVHKSNCFLHTEAVIVKRIQDKYKVVFLTGVVSKFNIINIKNDVQDLEVVSPNQYLSDNTFTHPLGKGLNCLELAIYSMQNLNMETGIILNGEDGHSIDEIKKGDKYIAVETAKIVRSAKYLEANGVDIKAIKVLNTNNQEQTLENYRETYNVNGLNQFLTYSANAKNDKRLFFKRQNSLDDISFLDNRFIPNDPKDIVVKQIKQNILNRF